MPSRASHNAQQHRHQAAVGRAYVIETASARTVDYTHFVPVVLYGPWSDLATRQGDGREIPGWSWTSYSRRRGWDLRGPIFAELQGSIAELPTGRFLARDATDREIASFDRFDDAWAAAEDAYDLTSRGA